ncbi:MAG: acyl carrier protein [Actinocatenispora sp.]
MDEQSAVELVISVVSKSRTVDPSLLSESTHFVDDLGFDSLDASELLAALHQQTGRRLAITDLSELATIGQVAKALAAQEVAEEVRP